MKQQSWVKKIKKYQKASDKKRREYFKLFEEKMIYRTTKTENPEVTRGMVKKVLEKLKT